MMYQPTDDAFEMEGQDQIILRVLSGSQRGAEMRLLPMSYSVGQSDDADIILADSSVDANHFSVKSSGAKLLVSAHDGMVVLSDQVLQPGDTAEVDLPCAVLVGMVHIGFGAPSSEWANLVLPSAPPPVEKVEEPEEDAAHEDESAAEQDEVAEASTDNAEPSVDTPAAQDDVPRDAAAEPAPEQVEPEKQRSKVWVLAAALALISAAGAGYFLLQNNDVTETAPQAALAVEPVDTSAVVDGILDDLGLTLVSYDQSDAGLVLTGIVDTLTQEAELVDRLNAAGVPFVDRIRVAEQLVQGVRLTLGHFNWPAEGFADHLDVRHVGAGQLELTGFLGPEVDVSELHRAISSDVPGITGIRFVHSDLGYWRNVLADEIEKVGLTDWLKVSTQGSELAVHGELTAQQARTWQAAGESFVALSKGWPKIFIGVSALPDPIAQLNPELSSAPNEVPLPDFEARQIGQDQLEAAADAMRGMSFPSTLVIPDRPDLPSLTHSTRTAAPARVVQSPQTPQNRTVRAPDSDGISVIGVITASSGTESVALLSDGRDVREGDLLDDGSIVTEITIKGIALMKDDQDIFLHVEAGQ